MTIKQAKHQYLVSSSSRLASNTIKIYEMNLRKFEEYIGGNKYLSELTNFDIENFQLMLKNDYAEKSQVNFANTLRSFAKYWFGLRETKVSWELIRGPRIPEKLANFITLEQFQKIDLSFKEDEYYQLTKKVIFQLLWNTGLRINELLSLNISDIDSSKNYMYITTEKSKKLRVVMWNEECHQLLLKYISIRICLNKAPELFQSPTGKNKRTRLTARSVQRWSRELGEKLGFAINPHAFRHGKMHFIINNGGGRHHVQAVAGHSSISSSEAYLRLNVQEQTKIQEQFLPPIAKQYNVTKSNELRISTSQVDTKK